MKAGVWTKADRTADFMWDSCDRVGSRLRTSGGRAIHMEDKTPHLLMQGLWSHHEDFDKVDGCPCLHCEEAATCGRRRDQCGWWSQRN